jgi:hypothetical protein
VLSRLLKPIFLAIVPAGFLIATTGTPETKVQGVLIDRICSYKAETRVVPGPRLEGGIIVAYAHTRRCALMPECRMSGYGVVTYDEKFLAFDQTGNEKALVYFKHAKQEDNFRVEVTGKIQGDTIKVTSIQPLE